MPLSIAAHLGFGDNLKTEDVADLQIEYPCDRLGYAHLSWRSPVRRTSAMIYGSEAALEIQDNHLTLTDRSGRPEDYCIDDSLGDSYHPGWFAGVAEDFERAIHAGAGNAATRKNLLEAETAVALVSGARKSASTRGARVSLG